MASSERGLGLLFESEKVGTATAVELTRQKEQLLNTESKLDEINSSLRQSERHLQGIRSVFGSVRNYFTGRPASAASTAATPAPGDNRNTAPPRPGQSSYNDFNNRVSQSHHNISGGVQQQKQLQGQQSVSSAVDEQLDRNLDDMASSLARLKGLAQGLNTELDEHNDIMDRVADKADMVGFKVDKQNKDMNKILKK